MRTPKSRWEGQRAAVILLLPKLKDIATDRSSPRFVSALEDAVRLAERLFDKVASRHAEPKTRA